MRAIVLFFLISGMLTACGTSNDADIKKTKSEKKLQIISTIKPIQAIVVAIAGDLANSEQLIPDNASPHDYSFKPSDIRKVKNADIIFRIDEHMEIQLNAVFEGLNDNTPLISLAGADGIKLLEAGHLHSEKVNDSKNKEHKNPIDDEHQNHEGHDNIDFHIWTSPNNVINIATEVTRQLSKIDSKNATLYQANLNSFVQLLNTEVERISATLMPFKNKPYIVFHDSWQYFANEFGLQKPTVVDMHEGVSSGAKTVSDIRAKIVKDNITCIFYDSNIIKARLKILSENTKAVAIDVLARNIKMSQSAYIDWLRQLSNQVESCLSD